MRSFRTAGISSQPGRCRILSGTTFLPHQEAAMTSGAAAITLCGETIRSLAAFCFLNSGNTSSPPAISMSSRDPANAGDERIVPLLEINLLLPSPANRRRHLVKASTTHQRSLPPERLRLADVCSHETIVGIESGRSSIKQSTIDKVRSALEKAGVEFIDEDNDGLGVRLRKRGASKPKKGK